MYGPAASPLGRSYAVDCSAWQLRNGESAEKQQLVEQVLEKLRRNLGRRHWFFGGKWVVHSGKMKMVGWKMDPEWRCIFCWKSGYPIATLVYQRVAACHEIFLQWVYLMIWKLVFQLPYSPMNEKNTSWGSAYNWFSIALGSIGWFFVSMSNFPGFFLKPKTWGSVWLIIWWLKS